MLTLGQAPRYRAWILRCRETPGEEADQPMAWHFSVENPHTHERRGFTSLEALIAFLRADLAVAGDTPPGSAADAEAADDHP